MKFVIFGEGISVPGRSGEVSPWRGLCGALAQRGHRIVFFERDAPEHAARRESGRWSDGELWIYPDFNKARYQARRHLADADVAIVTSDCPDARVIAELVIESSTAVRAFYELNAAAALERAAKGGADPAGGAQGLRGFDLVLSYSGGRALDELQQRLGARRVATLYGGVDPEVFARGARREGFKADLSFAGAWTREVRETLNEWFMVRARWMRERRFVATSVGEDDGGFDLNNVIAVGPLEPAERVELYSSSRLVLNVTPRVVREMGFCPGPVLFEAAACGTPVVSDGWHGMNLFFEPGEEILVVNTLKDVEVALNLSDEELAGIAKRARERVLDEHTVAHRATHLETIVENTINAGAEAELAHLRETTEVGV